MSDQNTPSAKEQMIWVMSYLSNINAGKFETKQSDLQINADQVKTILSGTNDVSNFLNQFFSFSFCAKGSPRIGVEVH